MIRKRTAFEKALAFVRKLNEPRRKQRRRRVEWATPDQIRDEFRAAAQRRRA